MINCALSNVQIKTDILTAERRIVISHEYGFLTGNRYRKGLFGLVFERIGLVASQVSISIRLLWVL